MWIKGRLAALTPFLKPIMWLLVGAILTYGGRELVKDWWFVHRARVQSDDVEIAKRVIAAAEAAQRTTQSPPRPTQTANAK